MTKSLKTVGYSLLELLLCLALVAILAHLAQGSYRSYQRRQNREFAKYLLLMNVAKMEKYYAQHGRYVAENGNWPTLFESNLVIGGQALYRLGLPPSTAAAQSYCIIATAISGTIQAEDADICIDNGGRFRQSLKLGCEIHKGLNRNGNSYYACN